MGGGGELNGEIQYFWTSRWGFIARETSHGLPRQPLVDSLVPSWALRDAGHPPGFTLHGRLDDARNYGSYIGGQVLDVKYWMCKTRKQLIAVKHCKSNTGCPACGIRYRMPTNGCHGMNVKSSY